MDHYLRQRYETEIAPALMKDLELKSRMQVPRLDKIVVKVGVGEAIDNAKALDSAVEDITVITGQKPVVTKARKSISNFKLREGKPMGIKKKKQGGGGGGVACRFVAVLFVLCAPGCAACRRIVSTAAATTPWGSGSS